MNIKRFIPFILTMVAWLANTPLFAGDTLCSTDANGAITSTQSCNMQPDEYTINVFKVRLFTSDPGAPTASSAISTANSVLLFESSDATNGTQIKVIKGQPTTLTGTLRPPNGTYTYAYVELKPQIQVKATEKFSRNMYANDNAKDGNSNFIAANTSCWSKGINVFNWGNPPFNTIGWGAFPNPGTTIKKINSLSSSAAQYSGTFATSWGDTETAYLVDSNGYLGANATAGTMGTITRIIAIIPQSITVTSATASMDVAFNVGLGVNIRMEPYTGTKNGGDPNPAPMAIYYFGGGPFEVKITVQ